MRINGNERMKIMLKIEGGFDCGINEKDDNVSEDLKEVLDNCYNFIMNFVNKNNPVTIVKNDVLIIRNDEGCSMGTMGVIVFGDE